MMCLATPSPILLARGRVLDVAGPCPKSTSPLAGEDGWGVASGAAAEKSA